MGSRDQVMELRAPTPARALARARATPAHAMPRRSEERSPFLVVRPPSHGLQMLMTEERLHAITRGRAPDNPGGRFAPRHRLVGGRVRARARPGGQHVPRERQRSGREPAAVGRWPGPAPRSVSGLIGSYSTPPARDRIHRERKPTHRTVFAGVWYMWTRSVRAFRRLHDLIKTVYTARR